MDRKSKTIITGWVGVFSSLFLWFQFGDAATRSWTGDILRLESTTLPTVGTNGEIRLDTSDNKLKKYNSTDVAWQEIAGGAGGLFAGGQNLLDNNSWESNTNNWTASGGTYTRNTGAANLIPPGVGSGSWDSGSAAQTLTSESTIVTALDGLAARNGAASCSYKCASGTCTHLIEAYDGTNVLASTTITSSVNGFVRTSVNFPIPSSGTISLRTKSVASDEPNLYTDDCYLGLAEGFNIAQVSQASLHGSIIYNGAASCSWTTGNTAAAYTAFGADADCNSTTLSGYAANPATVIPGVTFSSLPAGEYLVIANGNFLLEASGATTAATGRFIVTDGTTNSNPETLNANSTNSHPIGHTLIRRFIYNTAQGSTTFQIKASSSSDSNDPYINNGANEVNFQILVYKFPSVQETLYKPEELNWLVDAIITGANPSMGTSAVSTSAEITDSGLTLTNSANATISAYIPCATTNASSGTTCSVGNEGLGVVIPNLPRAGKIEVCFNFSNEMSVGGSASIGGLYAGFSIVKTGNADQTVSEEGNFKASNSFEVTNTSVGTHYAGQPTNICSVFNVTSSGKHTFRLFYEQAVTGTVNSHYITADAQATINARNFHVRVRPIDVVSPPVVISGSINSNTTTTERLERAIINCNAASTIVSQSGTWLTAVGNGTGDCTLTIATGIFSAAPTCVVTPATGITDRHAVIDTTTTVTATTVRIQTETAGAPADGTINVICMGPR